MCAVIACSNQNSQNCALGTDRGTSMSTPVAAGAVALVRQYFAQGWYPTGAPVAANTYSPSGPLLKAIVMGNLRSAVMSCAELCCAHLCCAVLCWFSLSCLKPFCTKQQLCPFMGPAQKYCHECAVPHCAITCYAVLCSGKRACCLSASRCPFCSAVHCSVELC